MIINQGTNLRRTVYGRYGSKAFEFGECNKVPMILPYLNMAKDLHPMFLLSITIIQNIALMECYGGCFFTLIL